MLAGGRRLLEKGGGPHGFLISPSDACVRLARLRSAKIAEYAHGVMQDTLHGNIAVGNAFCLSALFVARAGSATGEVPR